ncbi:D-alanyl-D-alanine carboxypeptidase / D-alanyl-D-alanine-endopeptidase (penicillin-binding protein 4) [Yoonia tamlensis]|uniref:D-alanyl-D-alanine carboxypeptidase / D-alanyl-D-alanine-endopeptidase (Penicillin-binding protein 4) n=1 Tax=Yoonia tamlensis TaxID=390270 RepID=A0A1I6GW95_9RHOB|nr:D-alanyl-D-alanine carboxypeptidase/D-alanyl-D-alanine-endopeptidase [Yoonia tamlensis]SFR46351.1 D-alanyl-D-alanine carboxypeptidase / D-alanyl-D-alanine-endopeptidase (penicillin-binding protein 4) [Yoonia tamlensis]
MRLTRRAMLLGAVASSATAAWAEAPMMSLRPVARPFSGNSLAQMIATSGVTGAVGAVLADAQTGEVIDAFDAGFRHPPASVTKAFTALYALEHLGPQFQFETAIFADGPVLDGILDGDLILAGGGDPNLVTDQLATLAQQLRAAGIAQVTGEFHVWDDALTNLDEIDDSQLDYLGYNPTITGLNLNFNRVHFEWKREADDFATFMDARSENYRPAVTTSRITIADRNDPVFTYRDLGQADQWTVARSALNDAGSRWLPVRHPALYAGEVFATFARSHGIRLKAPKEIAAIPAGATKLTAFQSEALPEMMRAMMRYSTNITAEAAGLATTIAQTGQKWGLRASAARMGRWATRRAGGITPLFADHSGLGDASRLTPTEMVQFLTSADVPATLHPLMKEIPLRDQQGDTIVAAQGAVQAKTGTLNFVSNLAGYLRRPDGRICAFTIFASDLAARERGKLEGAEPPTGAQQWNRIARNLQHRLLRHWVL